VWTLSFEQISVLLAGQSFGVDGQSSVEFGLQTFENDIRLRLSMACASVLSLDKIRRSQLGYVNEGARIRLTGLLGAKMEYLLDICYYVVLSRLSRKQMRWAAG